MEMSSIVRWRPMEELTPRSFFRNFWENDLGGVFGSLMESEGMENYGWTPKVEAYRKNGTYVIKADLPGVETKDIRVELENGRLTIRGERKMDKVAKEKKGGRREVFYGSFERTMAVPCNLKAEEVKAKYHGGVLEITLPADEKTLPKKIKVEEVAH
jgi:HSP20 family protein